MNGGTEAGERLALTLAGSLILHFALVFGLQIRPQPASHHSAKIIQARLVAVPVDVPPPAMAPPEKAEALALQSEPVIVPEPERETASQPRQPAASAAPAEESASLPSIDVPLIEDPTFYPALEVDVHPTALSAVQPAYPDRAAKANVAGSVILVLLLDEGGAVKEVSVEEATPPGYFEESAVAAFRHARFTPAQRGGKLVKSKMRIKVSYELEGKDVK